jgi:hypothetical protein
MIKIKFAPGKWLTLGVAHPMFSQVMYSAGKAGRPHFLALFF